ncbi:MAG: hypothetical protein RBG13Loki_2705 [Promethearchaeota archaeon CR_4]|nr:MAG: hypothetical protein RBG13Loki_2705 [Candidatus Lokiarchaeota archaeon CR_4]
MSGAEDNSIAIIQNFHVKRSLSRLNAKLRKTLAIFLDFGVELIMGITTRKFLTVMDIDCGM